MFGDQIVVADMNDQVVHDAEGMVLCDATYLLKERPIESLPWVGAE